MKLFGIKNCDTVKKARRWLDDNQINFSFEDFREQGLSEQQLEQWLACVDWQVLFNKRSTSYRELATEAKETLNADTAKQLMLANPTLIKRPVLQQGEKILVGFNAKNYQEFLQG